MSSYYLKHRSKNIDELDQDQVRESLKKLIQSSNAPHAFLFSGPKGTGKTSAARILAKALNCENIKKGEYLSCNKCGQCKSIATGTNVDVIEMDAASNRGIDDIRSLKESVRLSPMSARNKIYIIDEAHMLTTEASNALLKTLEEPPAHVYFVLATTNPEKLIPTIKSRTTNIVFKKASSEEIVRSLSRAAKKEKIKTEDGALQVIAKYSDGSFRDALKNLESIVNENIKFNKESVEDFFLSKSSFTNELIDLFNKRELTKLLEKIKEVSDQGMDFAVVTKELLINFREDLIQQVIAKKKTAFTTEELLYLTELLVDANNKLKDTLIDSLPLEIASIKWCMFKDSAKPVNQSQTKSETRLNNPTSATNGKVNSTSSMDMETNISEELWKSLLTQVRPFNASTEALLRAARPISSEEETLTIAVYYKFHKEQLEDRIHRRVVEDVASELFGKKLKLVCVLSSPPQTITEETVPVETQTGAPLDTQGAVALSSDSPLTEEVNEDIMKIAQEVFEI